MLTGYGNLPTAVAAVKAGAIDYIAKPLMQMMLSRLYLLHLNLKLNLQKIQCQQIELSGNIFIEYLNFVIGMYLKLLEDFKCTEELYKEYFLKDLLDNLNQIFNFFNLIYANSYR